MSLVIGITGYATSGKDSVAESLIAAGVERLAFADTLREFVEAIDPWVPIAVASIVPGVVPILGQDPKASQSLTRLRRLSELLREMDEKYGTSPADGGGRMAWFEVKQIPEVRRLLQVTGTEAGRRILGENIWIEATFRKMIANTDYVITDVRFPNEAMAVLNSQDRDGVMWRVERPGVGPLTNEDGSIHESEIHVPDLPVNTVVHNDGTLDDLRARVGDIFAEVDPA